VNLSAVGLLGRGLATLGDTARGPRLSVLVFHRVHAQRDTLFPGEMDAPRFDAVCSALARTFNVLTLAQALALRTQRRLPGRALVITFDDGYADNAEVALPILRRHGLVATFFVATGFLDGGLMWNDFVIENLRRTPLHGLDLSELGLGTMEMSSTVDRRAVIDAVLPLVKYQPLERREAMLAVLQRACDVPDLPRHLMMRADQVRQLHAAGMEIGGHTVNHPILTELPDAQARLEIEEGRRALQQLTGAAVDVFAYPNGRPDRDYARRHVDMVAEAGFIGAVSTAPGTAAGDADADCFELPRFTPWDDTTALWLTRLLMMRQRGRHARASSAVT
jgi:peptidoglycan/xylan/chitin deacetylase (PgdA/CDA1 family)